MADIIDKGNEVADLFLKAALANREKCGLTAAMRCHYCDEDLRAGMLFCDSECSADWHEEQRRKRIAGR